MTTTEKQGNGKVLFIGGNVLDQNAHNVVVEDFSLGAFIFVEEIHSDTLPFA